MFLTNDYLPCKPSSSDLQTNETIDVPGRFSDISLKNPTIKAPRKHLESIKVGIGKEPKPVAFKAPW
jgi:hypothetical protein